MSKQTTAEVKRVGKFGVIGIINTLLDFGIYNVLSGAFGLALVPANFVSTSSAMVFSFFANKRLVFRSAGGNLLKQALVFFAVTAFGLYVLQNGVILLLTEAWTWPLELAYNVVNLLGLDSFLSEEFVYKNAAKAAATLVSLTWNYLMYKKVVFEQ